MIFIRACSLHYQALTRVGLGFEEAVGRRPARAKRLEPAPELTPFLAHVRNMRGRRLYKIWYVPRRPHDLPEGALPLQLQLKLACKYVPGTY